MKIIHCGDLHLDSPMGSNFTAEKANIRNAELRAAFARLIQFAQCEEVSAILIAGDLFDSPYVSTQTATFVAEQIRSAEEITFFYLRGNHDDRRPSFSHLQQPKNLICFSDTWKQIRFGSVVISAIEPQGDGWLTMYDRLQLSSKDLNIVMLHGQISTQAGQEQIALPLLKNKHIRYLALGHLHAYQKAPLDADGEYCYCGCLEGRGFDECDQKGFVMIETDGASYQSRFVPFAQRILHDIEVDISGLETATQILAAMKQAAAAVESKNLVKFTLVGTYTFQTQKDIHFLRKMLEPDFWFVKIKDESRLEIDRKSYAYDISLKGEFVRAVLASDYSNAEQERIINCGIRALNGEEVLL